MKNVRESNFELLRLIAMLFIVWYHTLLKFIVVVDASPIYQALFLPLHVAVICFVLISGYFHIKPSVHGAGKLFFPLFVFYLPLTLYEYKLHNVGLRSLLFFSQTPYWFIRTYFYLFLIAPVLNTFIVTNNKRIYLLLILSFMAIYMGWLMHDQSMVDGKNIVLFMLLYVLGDCLRHYNKKIERISTQILLGIYLILNVALICLYTVNSDTCLGKIIWDMSYPYCSHILIFNAILLFLLFSRLHFKSTVINWLATSVFTVYILHHQHYVLYNIIGPNALSLYRLHNSPLIVILYLGVFSLVIMFVCIIIDKIIEPLQKYFVQILFLREERIKVFFHIT